MSWWGENLGAPGVCHVSEVIRAGFEPCRVAGSSRGGWHPGRCSALSFETPLVILSPRWANRVPFQGTFSSTTIAAVVFNHRIVVFLQIRSNQSNPFAMG